MTLHVLQVTSFTRQDVLDYLAAWERPDTSILGMVGAARRAARSFILLDLPCLHLWKEVQLCTQPDAGPGVALVWQHGAINFKLPQQMQQSCR